MTESTSLSSRQGLVDMPYRHSRISLAQGMVSTISALNSFNNIEAYGFPQRHHSLTIITPADFCYLTVRVWLSHLERKWLSNTFIGCSSTQIQHQSFLQMMMNLLKPHELVTLVHELQLLSLDHVPRPWSYG